MAKKLKKTFQREIAPGYLIIQMPPGLGDSKKAARDTDAHSALICRLLKKSMILQLKISCARFVQNPTTFCHGQRIQTL